MKRASKWKSGQELMEYALIVCFVSVVAIVVMQALAGGKPKPAPSYVTQSGLNPQLDGRFKVTLAAEFSDDLAYGGKRRIYVIQDTRTEKEYLGVTGVGVSEVGTHGKRSNEDER